MVKLEISPNGQEKQTKVLELDPGECVSTKIKLSTQSNDNFFCNLFNPGSSQIQKRCKTGVLV